MRVALASLALSLLLAVVGGMEGAARVLLPIQTNADILVKTRIALSPGYNRDAARSYADAWCKGRNPTIIAVTLLIARTFSPRCSMQAPCLNSNVEIRGTGPAGGLLLAVM